MNLVRLMLVALLMSIVLPEVLAQQYVNGIQTGVIRIKVKPELVSGRQTGLKSSIQNGVAVTGVKALDALSEQYDVESIERVFRYSPLHEARHQKHGLHLWYQVKFRSKASPEVLVQSYGKIQEVEMAEPVLEKVSIPYSLTEMVPGRTKAAEAMPFNDPLLDRQWHYQNVGQNGGTPGADIRLFEAWKNVTGKRNVIVSIHDSGLDVDHEDLKANLWINEAELNGTAKVDDDNNGFRDDVYGYNFASNVPDIDKGEHGTHVAGTIGAVNHNGIGVAGIAGGSGSSDGVRLMACQILGGQWSDLAAESFVYAADNGAVISQNSWGYGQPNSYEQIFLDAIDYFIAEAGNYEGSPMRGGVVIFASGNNGYDLKMYPGAYEPVVAVSATGPKNEKAPYSNFGDWVDIAAPGGNGDWGTASSVLSTIPNNKYAYMDGTSMACPHVTGIAALIVSRNGGNGYTNVMLKRALLSGVSNAIYELPENEPYIGLLGVGLADANLATAVDQKKAPEAIANLEILGIAQDFATLKWSVPADEDDQKPSEFEILWSTSPITPANVSEAKRSVIKNQLAVSAEVVYEVASLDPVTTYYFAVRSLDRWANVSELSNVAMGKTNAGPMISADRTNLSISVTDAEAYAGSDLFHVLNSDEGLLRWTYELRHVRSTDSYSNQVSRADYPKGTTLARRPKLGKAEARENAAPQVVPMAQEPANAYFQYYDPYQSFYVIGETDTKLTNSSATRYDVTSDNGFNLTHAVLFLRHDTQTGPFIFEVRTGNDLATSKVTYSEQRTSYTTSDIYHEFALNEQIFFPKGSTFWFVVHVPSGNLFPLGLGFELEKQFSDYCYYSSDMGAHWNVLVPDKLDIFFKKV